MSRLNRVIPHRVGIELELIGDFMRNYKKLHPELNSTRDIKRHFNVLDFSEDWFDSSIKNEFNEIRVSINNAFQLKGLYRILLGIKKYCEMPIGGGIHIHIDISKYSSSKNKAILAKYINNRLDEVQDIFPVYTGKYNKKKVGIGQKATWVNISKWNSIEFRIAPLTFDYNMLLTWIVGCSKFVSKAIQNCHIKEILVGESRKNDADHISEVINFDYIDRNPEVYQSIINVISNSTSSYYIRRNANEYASGYHMDSQLVNNSYTYHDSLYGTPDDIYI
jgi:hypothetical protein